MTVWLEIDGKRRRVELPANAMTGDVAAHGAIECRIDGRVVAAEVCTLDRGVLSLIIDGRQYRCMLDGDAVIVAGKRFNFAVEDPRSLRGRRGANNNAAGPRTVKAPMPGRIVRLLVAEGDEVAEQQGVIVMEAMKMQNELKAPKAGRVSRIAVQVEGAVSAGETLVVIE